MRSSEHPLGTAQIYLLAENCDTLIHLIHIPSYYSTNQPSKGNLSPLTWTITFFDRIGNLIYIDKFDLDLSLSTSISVRELLGRKLAHIPDLGQFVISHSMESDFFCNFYTSYIQTNKLGISRSFRLHSHQKIFTPDFVKPNSVKSKIRKTLCRLGILNNIRYSSALSSRKVSDLSLKYIYLIVANHGNSEDPMTIRINSCFNNKNYYKAKLKAKAAPFGTTLVPFDRDLFFRQSLHNHKIELSINGVGTLSRKPILLILDHPVEAQNKPLQYLSISEMQHI